MAFRISSATFYPYKVEGELAGIRYSFTAHFAFLDQERIDWLGNAAIRRESLLRRGDDDPSLEGLTSRSIADEILVGWDGVTNDEDEPIPYSAAEKDRLLRIQGVANAIVKAWGQSIEGARVGNSKAPRGIG